MDKGKIDDLKDLLESYKRLEKLEQERTHDSNQK